MAAPETSNELGKKPENPGLIVCQANIDHARTAHALGLCVIPMREGEKRPAIKYKHLLESKVRPDAKTVEAQLLSRPNRNIGVLLGDISGGTIAIDFDDAEEYRIWTQEKPELADWLPTVMTRKGFHVYFQSTEGFTGSHDLRGYGATGEIKGNGTLTVYPGSIVDGHEYTWTVPPIESEGIPRISLVQSGLVPDEFISSILELETTKAPKAPGRASSLLSSAGDISDKTTTNNCTENIPLERYTCGTEHTEHTEHTDSIPPASNSGFLISEAIEKCSVLKSGQRNKALWILACIIVRNLGKTTADELVFDVHSQWWRRFGSQCSTDELESEGEYSSMVERVICESPFLRQLGEQFRTSKLPNWHRILPPREVAKDLSRVIVCADDIMEGGVFFLTIQKFCDLSGYESKRAVHNLLRRLAYNGVIKEVEKGNCRRATRYRLLLNGDGSIRQTPKTDRIPMGDAN